MSTATLEAPAVTITEAAPLTIGETNSLITLAAGTEKIARVKANGQPGESRGFSLGGNVD